MHRSRRSHNSL